MPGETVMESPAMQNRGIPRRRQVPDRDLAFVDGDEGGAVGVLHHDIEDRAAHRNDRRRAGDLVRIRHARAHAG